MFFRSFPDSHETIEGKRKQAEQEGTKRNGGWTSREQGLQEET